MLRRPVFGASAARLSSHFKQRTRLGLGPAAMGDSSIKMRIYKEQNKNFVKEF
jgi:hypothetical protein